jgi:hypothetical protein
MCQHYISVTPKSSITFIATVDFNYIACSVKLLGKHMLFTSHEHVKSRAFVQIAKNLRYCPEPYSDVKRTALSR